MPESNVERTLGIILASVEDIKRRMDRADDSRATIHDGINALTLRVSHIETDVHSLKGKVEGVEAITEDVKKIGLQAQGAGTAGKYAVKVGIGVVSALGWAVGVYTWLTGRPPP